jgi:phytol kinase
MNFVIFFVGLSALFLMLDLLQKKVLNRIQWSRKATHILSGVVIYFMPLFLSRYEIFWMAMIFVFALSFSKWKTILSLHNVERRTLGEVFYPLSVAILAVFCLPDQTMIFQISILVLAFSDGMAGLVGELWDYRPVIMFRNKKSMGGSICFFVVTCLLFCFFHGFYTELLPGIIAASLFLTIIEFVLVYGFDNLALPLATALIEFIFYI